MPQKFGVDIVGFGPIGRKLAELLTTEEKLKWSFKVSSISDSSGCVNPSKGSEVLSAIEWKNSGKALGDMQGIKLGNISDSGSTFFVDVTNSDYSKAEEARGRAFLAFDSERHFVSANKVAFANYFNELFARAKRKDVEIGFGATIAGGRYAISIIRSIDRTEIQSVSALLNTSTTLILSSLEGDPGMTLDRACRNAAEAGILERDWSIDLDGVDAAAKSAILSNVIFPKSKISIKDVKRRGIRDERARKMLEENKKGSSSKKIRLVAELNEDGATVAPKILPADSALAISGRYNIVLMKTETLGEISVRNLGGGVTLTASVIISDLKRISQNH